MTTRHWQNIRAIPELVPFTTACSAGHVYRWDELGWCVQEFAFGGWHDSETYLDEFEGPFTEYKLPEGVK